MLSLLLFIQMLIINFLQDKNRTFHLEKSHLVVETISSRQNNYTLKLTVLLAFRIYFFTDPVSKTNT
jgi:hypothetical protein